MTVGLPEIWSKFKIEIAASDGRGSYRKKQKYLIQFHNFIKEIEILGRDPQALFHSNIPTRSGSKFQSQGSTDHRTLTQSGTDRFWSVDPWSV